MKWKKWLDNWDMASLKISTPFLDLEFKPQHEDKQAAWEMYIELLTRITTQALPESDGDEKSALDSIYSLFPTTREIIRRNGRSCIEFTKIAIVILNQLVRPFTAKWHKVSISGGFEDAAQCAAFRDELAVLQNKLQTYTAMLAQMAGVEDLSQLEENGASHE